MKSNHNSAKCLVSRISFRGMSLILALILFLESCHETANLLVPGQKIAAVQPNPKGKGQKRKSLPDPSITTTVPPSSTLTPTKKPKISESSSKNEGEKTTEVGKETGSPEISQTPSKKKKRRRKRKRSSLSSVTSPTIASTPVHSPAKKLKEESKSPTVSPNPKKYTPKGSEEEKEEAQESNESEEEGKDKLEEYDYNQLVIPIKLNEESDLPIVAKPRETLGKPKKAYEIDGKIFKRQNVSGDGMRCFFNAAGLNVAKQIKKLRKYRNDPIIRFMIANELVSAAKTSYELPKEVKDAINYTLYESQQKPINRLRKQRNKALKKQSTDDKKQNIKVLSKVFQNIDEQEEKVTAELRKRACSLAAFNAFLDHHIRNKQMMVALHDIGGDDPKNRDINYTSIDAIAYINQLGINIYQPNTGNGKLRLTHQFIPANATRIIYLYHEGVHFQSLVAAELGVSVQISPSKQTKIGSKNSLVSSTTQSKEGLESKKRDEKGKQKLTNKELEELEKKRKSEEKKAKELAWRRKLLDEEEEALPQLLVESYAEAEGALYKTSASLGTPSVKVKKKPYHESPDKPKKLQNKVEIKEVQYHLARKLFKEYEANKGSEDKVKKLLQDAIGWYKKAAKKGHKKAQDALIELRNEGLYSNLDPEVMAWYKKAVKVAIKAKPKLCPTFEEFQNRAREIMVEYKKEIERIKKVREGGGFGLPTWRGPMRLSDLIVMDLDPKKVPARIEWGGDYILLEEANADYIFGPLFELDNTEKYEDAVLAIDPAEGGSDEVAYCVAKRYGDYYFIAAIGGLAGEYSGEESKASIGNSPAVLDKLIAIAMEHNVSRLRIEKNKDYSFAGLLEARFLHLKLSEKFARELENKALEFNLEHQRLTKETKLLDTLHPLLREHRLIVDRHALKDDFESAPVDDLYYKFFYQLMTVIENTKKSKTYFDGNTSKHDDRIDVVVDAIRYLQERRGKREEFRSKTLKKLQDKAQKGGIKAQLELGKRYKNGLGVEQDYKEALRWYEMAAEAENPPAEALFNLGEIYRKDSGRTNKNMMQARKYYQKAASQTYAPAKYELAKMFQSGFGELGKKEAEAEIFKLYSAAASQGHAGAAYELGKLYQNGVGEIKKDSHKASIWYKKAAEQGHAVAAYELAEMFQSGFGKVKADPAQAFKWYLIAAENGHCEAQLEVADGYYNGQVVDLSYKKAFEYYFEAAFNGNTSAQYKLAKMYQNGWGVDKNNEQALKWYLAAAERDLPEAQLEVGRFYQHQWGLAKPNKVKAKEWYKQAAEQGNAEASYYLGRLCEKKKKYKKAYKWYEKSAEKGYKAANNKLGWMNQDGLGVEKNVDIALYYYKKGIE